MNKIAICISGQVRNDASLRALADSLNDLSVEVDVFVSIWARQGTRSFTGFNSPGHLSKTLGRRLAFSTPLSWVENMNSVFPESDDIFPPAGVMTAESIHEFFPNAAVDIEDEDINFSFPHRSGNSLRMLYKIWRCNSLMRKSEIAHNKRYDLVVRMRPDIVLNFKKIMTLAPEEDELLAMKTRPVGERHLGDMYWIGTSKTAEKMAGGFARAVDAQTGKWSTIHRELFDHAENSGLKISPQSLLVKPASKYSKLGPEYSKALQKSFVSFVQNRRMNIAAAGGESFCEIAEYILSAALAEVEGHDPGTNTAGLISVVTEFLAENPDQSVDACLVAASHLATTRYSDFSVKFEFALYYIRMRHMHRKMAGLTHFVSTLSESFAGKNEELVRLVAGFIRHSEDTSYYSNVPDTWDIRLKKRPDVKNEIVYKYVLENDRFYNWLLKGATRQNSDDIQTIMNARENLAL